MSTTLNRVAYEKLIDEDITWLKQQPQTLERSHIEVIVAQSVKFYYKFTWLIWSNEHKAWWRENGNGYSTDVRFAGRFEFDRAIEICRAADYRANSSIYGTTAPPETMVPAEFADRITNLAKDFPSVIEKVK